MFLTRTHIPRRAMLKGLGVSIALPWLDAMTPALSALARDGAAAKPQRLVAMEMVHGVHFLDHVWRRRAPRAPSGFATSDVTTTQLISETTKITARAALYA